jgi:thiol-disulfide isomerase/thioredoxin
MGLRLPLLKGRSFLASVLAALVGSCASSPPAAPSSSAPTQLPDVEVATLSGGRTSVGHVADGRVALVSLWATWCDACAKEMDSLNRLDAKASAERAVVIGVDIGEDREKVASFAQRRRLRYVQLVDESFVFADALGGQRRLPATLVLDRRGRVIFRGDALDSKSLDAFRKALEESPPR